MSQRYLVYDLITGFIESARTTAAIELNHDEATQGYIRIDDCFVWANKVVDTRTKTIVPAGEIPYKTVGQAVADDTSEYSISGLPEGTSHEGGVITDCELVLTFDTPGPHLVNLQHPVYSPLELTINVEPT